MPRDLIARDNLLLDREDSLMPGGVIGPQDRNLTSPLQPGGYMGSPGSEDLLGSIMGRYSGSTVPGADEFGGLGQDRLNAFIQSLGGTSAPGAGGAPNYPMLSEDYIRTVEMNPPQPGGVMTNLITAAPPEIGMEGPAAAGEVFETDANIDPTTGQPREIGMEAAPDVSFIDEVITEGAEPTGFGEDMMPSDDLANLVGETYQKLLRGENPAFEQNKRMAMTHLGSMERNVQAQAARMAAEMNIRPGSAEYNQLMERVRNQMSSEGSKVMSGLAAQNLQTQQAALAQAGQFAGQQQRLGFDYAKFTHQKMTDDRNYRENVRRWDKSWAEDARRYGEERADELASQRMGKLMDMMKFVDYMSPGQFGTMKDQLASLIGIEGFETAEGEPSTYQQVVDYYVDRGWSEEDATARAEEVLGPGGLDPFDFLMQGGEMTGALPGGEDVEAGTGTAPGAGGGQSVPSGQTPWGNMPPYLQQLLYGGSAPSLMGPPPSGGVNVYTGQQDPGYYGGYYGGY